MWWGDMTPVDGKLLLLSNLAAADCDQKCCHTVAAAGVMWTRFRDTRGRMHLPQLP